jgi:hypothetical protein
MAENNFNKAEFVRVDVVLLLDLLLAQSRNILIEVRANQTKRCSMLGEEKVDCWHCVGSLNPVRSNSGHKRLGAGLGRPGAMRFRRASKPELVI